MSCYFFVIYIATVQVGEQNNPLRNIKIKEKNDDD